MTSRPCLLLLAGRDGIAQQPARFVDEEVDVAQHIELVVLTGVRQEQHPHGPGRGDDRGDRLFQEAAEGVEERRAVTVLG